MAGTVGVISTDLARYTMFTQCLVHLRVPPNTDMRFCQGGDFAVNRNSIVRTALEIGTEWVMFIDDDMLFGPDHLLRLLSHDKDIVSSLYCRRTPPYGPLAYESYSEETRYSEVDLGKHKGNADTLIPIIGAGCGGMLIRAEVFHAIGEDGWFEKTTKAGEDLDFCAKAIDKGFQIHLDLGAVMGHCTTGAYWPDWDEEYGWATRIVMADGSALVLKVNG